MKTIQDYEEYPSFKALQMGVNENDVQLRAAGYFVKASALRIKENLQSIEECIARLEEFINKLPEEPKDNEHDHLAA